MAPRPAIADAAPPDGAPLIAVGRRFLAIDGTTQGALLGLELFSTMIPLMVLGFAHLSGFARMASVGDLFIRQLGVDHPLDDTVRSLFGSSDGLRSAWTIAGLAGFLVWGIPMSATVAAMFAAARRVVPRVRGHVRAARRRPDDAASVDPTECGDPRSDRPAKRVGLIAGAGRPVTSSG